MKKIKRILILSLLILASMLYADQRDEPVDVIVALDKSLSMEEEIEAVKDYVNTYLIDQLLIPGDYFLTVAFYGQTEIPVSLNITGDEDKRKAKEIISGLLADGRFTDIGNALDVLGRELDKRADSGRKKYLLLITDGIQEAPPESKYYSPDGSFNHEFLKNTRTIQKKGWKIHVLGIGTYQAARDLAQELGGKYTKTSETPTKEEIIARTRDFLASINMIEAAKMSPVSKNGRGTLTIVLQSSGYSEEKVIEIGGVELALDEPGRTPQNILHEKISVSIEPDKPTSVRLPVRISGEMESGDHSGELEFIFAGEERFIPVVTEIQFRVKSTLASYWYLIPIGVALLAGLILLPILLVTKIGFKRGLRFRLLVEDQVLSKNEEFHTLKEGRALFLNEADDKVSIVKTRNSKSVAKLSVFKEALRMAILKSDRFPKLGEVPGDVLDFSFRIRTESGKNITVRLGRIT